MSYGKELAEAVSEIDFVSEYTGLYKKIHSSLSYLRHVHGDAEQVQIYNEKGESPPFHKVPHGIRRLTPKANAWTGKLHMRDFILSFENDSERVKIRQNILSEFNSNDSGPDSVLFIDGELTEMNWWLDNRYYGNSKKPPEAYLEALSKKK